MFKTVLKVDIFGNRTASRNLTRWQSKKVWMIFTIRPKASKNGYTSFDQNNIVKLIKMVKYNKLAFLTLKSKTYF